MSASNTRSIGRRVKRGSASARPRSRTRTRRQIARDDLLMRVIARSDVIRQRSPRHVRVVGLDLGENEPQRERAPRQNEAAKRDQTHDHLPLLGRIDGCRTGTEL